MPRRTRRTCPEDCGGGLYDPREVTPCCCEDEWYRRPQSTLYYASDIPPCPPAPAQSNPALYRDPPPPPGQTPTRYYRDPTLSQTPTRSHPYRESQTPTRPNAYRDPPRSQTPSRSHPYRDPSPGRPRSVSRSSSRELKANGAPYCQRRRDETDSEDDIVAMTPGPLTQECRCACDQILNGSYRQLKEVSRPTYFLLYTVHSTHKTYVTLGVGFNY